MRVLVDNLFNGKQVAGLLQLFGDGLVGLVGGEARKLARILGQLAYAVDRNNNLDLGIVVDADFKVLDTVPRSGVDAAGTGIQGDVVADDDQRVAVEERMLADNVLQLLAGDRADQLIIFDLRGLHRGRSKLLGHDIIFAVGLDCAVFILRAQTDGHVAWQGPGSGGPDNEVGLGDVDAQLGKLALVVLDSKLDIDREAWILLVLDLRLSQCGVAVRAPVNRFEALVDIALLRHVAEDLNLLCLKLRLEGHVRIFPLAQNAQAHELAALDIQIVQGKFLADFAQLDRADVACDARFLSGLELDRQAVGVPAGNVRRLIAAHIFLADDEVLEHLVERGAQMDVAVGVRGAVVQNIERLALVVFDHLVVQLFILPVLHPARFALRQRAAHVELGGWQVQGFVVILSHFLFLSSILYFNFIKSSVAMFFP